MTNGDWEWILAQLWGPCTFLRQKNLFLYLLCLRSCFLAVLLMILDPEPGAGHLWLWRRLTWRDTHYRYVYFNILRPQRFIQIYFTWNAWLTLSSVIGDLRRCEGLFLCRSQFYLWRALSLLLFSFIYQGSNFLLQNVFNHKILSSAFTHLMYSLVTSLISHWRDQQISLFFWGLTPLQVFTIILKILSKYLAGLIREYA